MKFLLTFFCLFSVSFTEDFHSFDAIKGFEKAQIFLPSNCLFTKNFGDIKITCNGDIITVQAIKVELGCYESAKILVDLGGDEPRNLKIRGLNNEKIDTRSPFKNGIFTLDFTPVYEKSSLFNVMNCANGILLSFFGKNEKFVKEIAVKSNILN